MKLLSMTDFVLLQRMTTEQVNISSFQQIQNHISTYYDKVYAYAKFLKQPLTLGMFVPCDEEGNVLEEPDIQIGGVEKYTEKYQQAKERVLFEGFSVDNNLIKNINGNNIMTWYLEARCIEDLMWMNLTLTQTSIKQIGL